ncbi:MAG: hypothetical protein GWN58_26465, partial [Anaerolineae bacterium]|nr:hypothetical protein [Anaerolineae bacterium]
WPVLRQDDSEILYQDPDGEFTITRADAKKAIDEGRRRVGPEFAALLEAETMTEAEEAEAGEPGED